MTAIPVVTPLQRKNKGASKARKAQRKRVEGAVVTSTKAGSLRIRELIAPCLTKSQGTQRCPYLLRPQE